MKEFKPLQYGESGAIDYLPGAEVLKTTDERDEHGKDRGMLPVYRFSQFLLCNFDHVMSCTAGKSLWKMGTS